MNISLLSFLRVLVGNDEDNSEDDAEHAHHDVAPCEEHVPSSEEVRLR